MPIINCLQEIPCNPCSTVCPTNSINMIGDPIMSHPKYDGSCIGCGKCVTICPGLAITLVDYRKDKEFPIVSLPYEVFNVKIAKGDKVKAVDIDGNFLAELEVTDVVSNKNLRTQLVRVRAPRSIAKQIVSFIIQEAEVSKAMETPIIPAKTSDDAMICLCERTTVGDVRKLIRKGLNDLNQIKAITRSGMGPCGSKTCEVMIKQIFREEGIPIENVIPNTRRPVFIEVPLGKFADGQVEE